MQRGCSPEKMGERVVWGSGFISIHKGGWDREKAGLRKEKVVREDVTLDRETNLASPRHRDESWGLPQPRLPELCRHGSASS